MIRIVSTVFTCLLLGSAPLLAADMAYDDNFIIFAPTKSKADETLARANVYRGEIAKELFGEELPPGIGRTRISVRISDREDNGLTWPVSGERRFHMIWVTSSERAVLANLLKHEIAHVVLATRFADQLPPWADEGIASRYDDEKRIGIRRRILAWFAETGNWPHLERLLNDALLSSNNQASYATAASLTEFLLSRGDHATFFAFAIEGKRDSWEKALRQHYRIGDLASLEAAWRAWLAPRLSSATRTLADR
jgi:hypothetical protein